MLRAVIRQAFGALSQTCPAVNPRETRTNKPVTRSAYGSCVRTAERSGTSAATIGNLEIDPRAYRATLGGCPLALPPSQFDLLSFLVTNRDRVVPRGELARAAGLEQAGSVDVALSCLRRLLGEGSVRNVRNRGWILEPSAFRAHPLHDTDEH
jgi:DNA-binding response OmpR family regulator